MGALAGVKVVELAGLGPTSQCAAMLADMGADVLRIERRAPRGADGAAGAAGDDAARRARSLRFEPMRRGRRAIALDLKRPEAVDCVLRLVAQADALIEGFRPGVMERLGLGPEPCLARNPRLVYGRLTGWGQQGPLAHAAGHDINYLALTGVLHAIGRRGQPPTVPLNLVADFGGGAMLLMQGLLAGIISARATGSGQVVDAAMVDGVCALATGLFGRHASGQWRDERGTNVLDSGAHFYDVYECADGRWLAVGAIEPQFHAELLRRIEVDPVAIGDPADRSGWERNRQVLAARFRTRTRDEWCALLEGTDACVSPVLDLDEAARHPHMRARGTLVEVDGVVQPAPAPRFGGTPSRIPGPPRPVTPEGTDLALSAWLTADEIDALRSGGVVD